MTYEEIINQFKTICQSHYQVNEFSTSPLLSDFEVGSKGDQNPAVYPYVFLQPTGSGRLEKGKMVYSFNMIVADRVKRDQDKETNTISDMIQIGQDIIAYWNYSVPRPDADIMLPVTIIPFVERFDGVLSGATFGINIETPFILDKCIAPFKTLPPPTPCGERVDVGFTYQGDPLNPWLVTFTSTSTPAGVGVYNWDFGDGSTSQEHNPTHEFDSSTEEITVTLTIVDCETVSGPATETITFQPFSVSRLQHWWRSGDLQTLNVNRVSEWEDKINGKILRNPDASRQPYAVASDANWNNQPMTNFTGGFQHLFADLGMDMSSGEDVTFIIIGQTSIDKRAYFAQGWLNDTRAIQLGVGAGYTNNVANLDGAYAYRFSGSGNLGQGFTGSVPARPHMFAYTYQGSTGDQAMWYNDGLTNNKQVYTGIPELNWTLTSDRRMITGCLYANSGQTQLAYSLVGNIAEIIVTKGYLDTTQWASLSNYLNIRYGI